MNFREKVSLQNILSELVESHQKAGCRKRVNRKGKELPPLHYLIYNGTSYAIICGTKDTISKEALVVCRLPKDLVLTGPNVEEWEKMPKLMYDAPALLDAEIAVREAVKARNGHKP